MRNNTGVPGNLMEESIQKCVIKTFRFEDGPRGGVCLAENGRGIGEFFVYRDRYGQALVSPQREHGQSTLKSESSQVHRAG